MTRKVIRSGILHAVPKDVKVLLERNESLRELWNELTPIARNEWICWITIVKKQDTRERHIKRLQEELLKGKKRPCCWPGCPHRRDSAKKWFKGKK